MASPVKSVSKNGCIECGKEIATILVSLGSVTCHDCRKPVRPRLAA